VFPNQKKKAQPPTGEKYLLTYPVSELCIKLRGRCELWAGFEQLWVRRADSSDSINILDETTNKNQTEKGHINFPPVPRELRFCGNPRD
jgi:hypothetical protein